MAKLELDLSEGTIARLRALADARHATVESLIEHQFAPSDKESDLPLWGLLVNEPELADALEAHIAEMSSQTEFRTGRG